MVSKEIITDAALRGSRTRSFPAQQKPIMQIKKRINYTAARVTHIRGVDRMTNREKLKEIFPKTIFIYHKKYDKTDAIMCSDEWLDAEYIEPQESEGEE